MKADWPDDVLNFWFSELKSEDWYEGAERIDVMIRERFSGLYNELREHSPKDLCDDPRTALAAVIVCDQFSRNMFRRQAAAFGTDDLAIGVAREALAKGFDTAMTDQQKQFLYMPFMHSEILTEQERGIDLFRMLGNEDAVKFAIEHRDIIARFGRFPHRNRALGRESTPAETEFLTDAKGYGQ